MSERILEHGGLPEPIRMVKCLSSAWRCVPAWRRVQAPSQLPSPASAAPALVSLGGLGRTLSFQHTSQVALKSSGFGERDPQGVCGLQFLGGLGRRVAAAEPAS